MKLFLYFIMSSPSKTQPAGQFTNQDIIVETGGVKFILKFPAGDNTNPVVVNPVSPNVVTPVTPIHVTPVSPVTPITPGPTIGPDGVIEMFPSLANPKHPALYLDLSSGKDPSSRDGPFCINYGGDLVPSQIVKGTNGATCLETEGHKVTYHSGAPSGTSLRAHWYYDGVSAFASSDKMKCWSDKPTPEYLNTDKTFYNFEMTAILEVGDELGKDIHQSCAFKTRSIPDKPDDKRRSTFEFCFPNSQKKSCYVNYNYAHATYAAASGVKEYTSEGKVEPNKPLGLKVVSIIADDKKSTWYGGYINTNPLTADGKINNEGWKLKAEYTATGIEAYNNIPPTWGGCTDYLRIDGYKKYRLYAFSIREIDKGLFKYPHLMDTAPGTQFQVAQPPAENPTDFNTVVKQ